MDVFISQTSWEESSAKANPGLTLVCRDVIAYVILGLEKGGLFMRAPTIYLPSPCGEKFLNRVKERRG
jgi:hypothetical protein